MSAPKTKEEMVQLFTAFIEQRPGLDPRDYSTGPYYNQDRKLVTKQRQDALQELRVAAYGDYDYTAMERALDGAWGGRLQYENGKLDYTAGQYWCTEYRGAALAVLEYYNRVRE